MNKNNKTIIGIIVILIVLGGLFFWGQRNQENHARTWPGTEVRCLIAGHRNLAQHFHPQLTIVINGEEQVISANLGISSACMAEIHTHDSSGEIHVESASLSRQFTVGDFFAVWGKTFNQNQIINQVAGEDGQVTMTVNGEPNTEFENYIMRDRDRIEIRFE